MPPYSSLSVALAALAEGTVTTEEFVARHGDEVQEVTRFARTDKKARAFDLAVSCLTIRSDHPATWRCLADLMVSFGRTDNSQINDAETHAMHLGLMRRREYTQAFHASLRDHSRRLVAATSH